MLKQALLSFVLASTSFAATLQTKTFTGTPGGFLVNSTLIHGEKEAILVDAAFTQADAYRIVAEVLDSKKNLTHVFVTHGHPDHYFGTAVVKQAFPKVKIVALPSTVAEIQKTWKAKVKQWKPMYGSNLADKPVVPEALKGNTLTLENETLEVRGPVQGDDASNSYVWIPSTKTLIAGDVVYAGVHVWTAETNVAARKAWSATLDQLNALGATTVIAGHQKPEQAANLSFTKKYLADFDQAVSTSKTSEEVQSKVRAKYPDLALDIILKLGADAQRF